MSNRIPIAYADIELQVTTEISVGTTSFTLNSATDDDGNALPAGTYCFTIDNGKSNKEYLIGQLNGTDVTAVSRISRQGVETSGAGKKHRVGARVIVSNFAALQRVADILRGVLQIDGDTPLSYDAEPTLADRKQFATVGYVLDAAFGGSIDFDSQVYTNVNAGQAVDEHDVVYLNEADSEWYLADADNLSTIDGKQLGIAKGSGLNGAAITDGVQTAGIYVTTGLVTGTPYYVSNTPGTFTSSAGTNKQLIGVAISSTRLLMVNKTIDSLTTAWREALEGAANTPNMGNPIITQDDVEDNTVFLPPQVVSFTSAGTWTKDAGLKYVVVEVQAGGAGGEINSGGGDGGGGGCYSRKLIAASALGATESIAVGAGGARDASGGASSFGTHVSAGGGTIPTGGTGTDGDINVPGGNGAPDVSDGNQSSSRDEGGQGGDSFFGHGAPFSGNTAANAATGYGAGGKGDSESASGTAGKDGIVIVTEHYV